MFQRLLYVFVAFFAVVLVYYSITEVATALDSHSFSLFSIPTFTPTGYGSTSGGLSSIDFSFFSKNGKGWNYITQGYGNTPYSYLYIDHWHNGIDIAASYGAPIYSPDNGTVVAIGNQDNYCPGRAFGRFVVVKDASQNIVLLYAHLGTIFVSPNATITKGQSIATIGSSGLETGAHLHFSVFEANTFSITPDHGCGPYPEGKDVNPVPYLELFSQ